MVAAAEATCQAAGMVSAYLSERRKWASKGVVGGTISRVSFGAGVSLAVIILIWPQWFAQHVPERVSRFVTALIPLCAGSSVFLVRWLLSPYFVYKDLKNQLKGKPLHEIAKKLANEVLVAEGPFGGRYQRPMILRLIDACSDFGDEDDVEAVCRDLDRAGHTEPFGGYEMLYGKGSFKGKRLKFLKDASITSFQINSEHDARNYLTAIWSEQNGLKPNPIPILTEQDVRTWWKHAAIRIKEILLSRD